METILIQNFKAIKNTAKREIKVANLTILMGEQATGKSTVAKLVYFFKKLPEEIILELLDNEKIDKKNFSTIISRRLNILFSRLFESSSLSNDFEVTYKYENNLRLKIFSIGNNGSIYLLWPSLQYANEIWKSLSPIYNSIIMSNEWHIEDYYE